MTAETQSTAAASGAGATAPFRENNHLVAAAGQECVSKIAGRVIRAIHDAVIDEKVTYDEYNAFKAWLIKVGEDGEWPLFLDLLVEHPVEEVPSDGGMMTATGHNALPDQTTSPSPEDHHLVGLVHWPWAGWYYETDDGESSG